MDVGATLGRESGESFVGDVETVAYVYYLSAFPNEGTDYVVQDFVGYLTVVQGEVEGFADFGRGGEKFRPVEGYGS